MDADRLKSLARRVLEIEVEGLTGLLERVDDAFVAACVHMLECRGRVVVIGMGKSGHIGNKIAATLASTGTPAFFVHPGEASHGDLGMITAQDVVLALSNSGETNEITVLLPLIKRLAIPLIAMTGRPDSTLAEAATVHVDVSVPKEACPLNLAPTASTTAALAMGDALAISLLESRGFSEEDFALSHPGGSLGRRLLLHVSDIMHDGDATPRVSPQTPLAEALLEMTQKGLGMTAVCKPDGKLCGIFTDGDLRRALDKPIDVHATAVETVMTIGGRTVTPGMLAVEALQIMDEQKINQLVVIDEQDNVVGALNMHDLLRAGVV